MKGLEISRLYFERYGRPALEEKFPECFGRIAAGLAGSGSDCFGFDDGISRDHDFGAGFCIWLNDADYDRYGFALARAYLALPGEMDGIKKLYIPPYGTHRFGVMRISDFFMPFTGCAGAPQTAEQWLYLPEHSLAAAVNGEVFIDGIGEFTAIRKAISEGMPEDVRLKKISARAIAMAQSGQYNFPRCLRHGEKGAAALALAEFAKNAVSLTYILNGRYAPFYKWALRGMRSLPLFASNAQKLEELLTGETGENQISVIEEICAGFASHFRSTGLSDSGEVFLEPHAYAIREKIRDPRIKAMHIMEG